MDKSTLRRKLPALLLVVAAGQVGLAGGASAQGGLLGTGVLAPPRPPVAPASAPVATIEAQIEHKLAALRYDVGPVDGVVDETTGHAIMAFQKVHGLPRTGRLSQEVAAQIMGDDSVPPAISPGGDPNRVEISLARQVLFMYENGTLTKIVSVSSGTSRTPTPTGTFRLFRFEPGWHTSYLGRLYNAEYFIGGYAIHGSTSVPAEPASHGCVRLPMYSAEWFPTHAPLGTQVVIVAT
ncbi:MAG: L,D-transpeptidase family protein [Acidimicrobiales bacterium]